MKDAINKIKLHVRYLEEIRNVLQQRIQKIIDTAPKSTPIRIKKDLINLINDFEE